MAEEMKNTQGAQVDNQEGQTEETITMTKEELQRLLQQEGDKRVSQALQTAKAKWEAEFKAKLEQEKSEAEKLAKMSEQERFMAELEKQKKQFEEERKQFYREKLELQTVKELSSLGLPTEFSSFVLGEDAETTKKNIEIFQAKWQEAIEKAVNEKLKGAVPKASGGAPTITPEQFKKMSVIERSKLYRENPELYKQLAGY